MRNKGGPSSNGAFGTLLGACHWCRRGSKPKNGQRIQCQVPDLRGATARDPHIHASAHNRCLRQGLGVTSVARATRCSENHAATFGPRTLYMHTHRVSRVESARTATWATDCRRGRHTLQSSCSDSTWLLDPSGIFFKHHEALAAGSYR